MLGMGAEKPSSGRMDGGRAPGLSGPVSGSGMVTGGSGAIPVSRTITTRIACSKVSHCPGTDLSVKLDAVKSSPMGSEEDKDKANKSFSISCIHLQIYLPVLSSIHPIVISR